MRVPGGGAEIFVARHRGRYLVHAPLLEMTCEVNRAFAEELEHAAEGHRLADRVLGDLEAHGFLDEPPPREPLQTYRRSGEITLALSARCNLRCRYCYAEGGDCDEILPIEKARIALRQTARDGVAGGQTALRVHLHGGGEPTVDWDLFRRVADEAERCAGNEGLAVHLTAGLNGVLAAGRARQAAALLDEATVSLDGGPEVQNRQRPTAAGGGSWSAVAESLSVLDAEGLAYGIRMTVTAQSVGLMEESVASVCQTCEARAIQVEPAAPLGRGRCGEVVDPHEFVEQFRRARRVAASYGRELRTSGARFPLVTEIFCRAVTGALCVKPSGRIVTCYEAPDEEGPFSVGRVDRSRSCLDVDDRRLRDMLRFAVGERTRCRECIVRYHCAGDCPMKRMAPGADERCRANRLLTLDQMLERLDGIAATPGETS